jgi:NTE family protein
MYEQPLSALVLSGGGARAAYQVGVLRALARLRRQALGPRARLSTPFGVITGTSAGAINACAIACHADRFDAAVEIVSKVWRDFSAEQVYRADSLGLVRTGAQWLSMLSLGWAITRWRRLKPRSLLDNAPLAALLERLVPLERLPMMFAQKQLHAVAVTASSYSSGEHCTFYDAAVPVAPWQRSRRRAVPGPLSHAHLLASSAIPFVFPSMRLQAPGLDGWFGDGSMRQTAPLSAAIHLGAERLFIVGVGRTDDVSPEGAPAGPYPSLAQIAGHTMASLFLDALPVDIERLRRINRTLALLPEQVLAESALKPIETLVISPSQRIDDIAERHVQSLPKPVRALLRGVGVRGLDPSLQATLAMGDGGTRGAASGAALASYLLFEAPYTRELMALGEADTEARAVEVLHFFGWDRVPAKRAAGPPPDWPPDPRATPHTASHWPLLAAPDIELP